MKKAISLILISIVFVACGSKYDYPQDNKLSSRTGALIDSTASYLPHNIEFDGNNYTLEWHKDILNPMNIYYSLLSEPLLYNYYLGRNIYRLAIIEKDQTPLIVSINKQDNETWIVSKKINPSFFNIDKAESDSLPIPDELASQFKNYSRALTTEETHAFDSIFQRTDFFHLTNDEVNKYYDSYYLLEGHLKDSYWCVYRSTDDNTLKSISEYMRSLTGF